ncbi:MAG: nucleoside/nucleotide kinase family protein [Clostridia bacterium]|nr:nucleoside/nucleotide kinase family protein [Clostridia bacterium]
MRCDMIVNGFPVRAEYEDGTVENVFRPLLRRWEAMRRERGGRLIVFLAAPPAAGKSTLAAFLQRLSGDALQAVGMDGFHYPQTYIETHTLPRGGQEVPMRSQKGAPDTFDVEKLDAALRALRAGDVLWPAYDRKAHDVVENAVLVTAPIVLVEGNYLLLDAPVWRDLPRDDAVFLQADEALLRPRLIARKMRGGLTQAEAEAYYEACDGPNARLVLERSLPADVTLRLTENGKGFRRA